jgi:hypothetical protein
VTLAPIGLTLSLLFGLMDSILPSRSGHYISCLVEEEAKGFQRVPMLDHRYQGFWASCSLRWLSRKKKSRPRGFETSAPKEFPRNYERSQSDVFSTNRILSELPLLLTSYVIKSAVAYRISQVCMPSNCQPISSKDFHPKIRNTVTRQL